MTILIKDPSPGGPTTDGTTIFTDEHNFLVDRIGGIAAPAANRVALTDANGDLTTSAAGTSGHVMTSNGASAPTFQAGGSGTWTDTSTNTGTNKTLNDFTNVISANEVHVQVRNTSGVTMNKGELVYVTGFNTGSGLATVSLADADGAGTMSAIGMVEDATIANNANGGVIISGRISGIDTSAFTANDQVYVSTTPGAISARPTGATTKVQSIGEVLRSHATLGEIELIGAGRANELPNLTDAHMWVGNATNAPIDVAITGDVAHDCRRRRGQHTKPGHGDHGTGAWSYQ